MIHNVLATLTINISNNNMRPFSPGDGRGSQTDWPSANHQYVLFSLDLCPTNGMCTNGETFNQCSGTVADLVRERHKVVFTYRKVLTKTPILMHAIQRNTFAAVRFLFPTGCALATRNAWDDGIALA